MKTLLKIVCLFPIFFLNMCTWTKTKYVDENSVKISRLKPNHEGSYETGEFGVYKFKAYKKSIELKASVTFREYLLIEVFDTDNDQKFDSVFTLYDGNWKFNSKPNARNNFKDIKFNLEKDFFDEQIKLASFLKKLIEEKDSLENSSSTHMFYDEDEECWEAYSEDGDY